MKNTLSILLVLTICFTGFCQKKKNKKKSEETLALVEALKPRVFCRFVPEREDDFMFENNYIAMRFYGPALRHKVEGAGCDIWTKNVEYPIINKWYQLQQEGFSYHIDRGEGWDGYKVSNSAGTGGTAIWLDGKREELDCFTAWKIIEQTDERCEFVLYYEKEIKGLVYKEEKKISLEMNQRLFHAESTFYKNDKIAKDLEICVGITTHDGKAIATSDTASGWISCWESLDDGFGLGTAVSMNPKQISSIEMLQGKPKTGVKNTGHILIIAKTNEKGAITYNAGYAWEKAGDITTQDQWTDYLKKFTTQEAVK